MIKEVLSDSEKSIINNYFKHNKKYPQVYKLLQDKSIKI